MGGLALKSTYTRRYSREEFDVASDKLVNILRQTFKRVEVPLFYSTKESFGDIDIIISMDDNSNVFGNMHSYITQTFMPNEIFHNGNAWSFDYKEIQVDLITCSAADFDSNYHYLAFNDLGNFIGRIAQKLGLKYGQEGLWYNHYFKDQKIGSVMISKDYPKIFEFLGFDYSEWQKGFSTLEDIFEYVIKNQYFDAEMFELKNLNKINRERNIKRKSYMSFLAYIAEHYSDKSYEFEDKAISVARANKFFPEARMTEKMRELEYLECKKLYIKSKFSGDVIMRRYGIKGKELGRALTSFKDYFGSSEEYDKFLLDETTDKIYEKFEFFYKEFLT